MLYNVTAYGIIKSLTNDVKENHPNLSDNEIKKLVLNALLANCVNETIMEQVDYLIKNNGY